MQSVADQLLISLSYCYYRFNEALEMARNQCDPSMDDDLCLQVLPEEEPEPSSNLDLSSVARWAYLGCVFQPGGL